MNRVNQLAKLVLAQFDEKTRDNGETFLYFKDSRKDWMQELARKAHADMLPNDYSYRFIKDALELVAEYSGADLYDLENAIVTDVYTSDLLKWLSSSNFRLEYVNNAVNDGLVNVKEFSIVDALTIGQYLERLDVLNSVITSLKEQE